MPIASLVSIGINLLTVFVTSGQHLKKFNAISNIKQFVNKNYR
jgi:hypothetical protein